METIPRKNSEITPRPEPVKTEQIADWLIEHATLSPNQLTELQIETKHEKLSPNSPVRKPNTRPMVPLGQIIQNHSIHYPKLVTPDTTNQAQESIYENNIYKKFIIWGAISGILIGAISVILYTIF